MNWAMPDFDSILDMERVPDNSICDADCRGANCCSGRAFCEDCGGVFCGCELDENGLCEECAEAREREEKEEQAMETAKGDAA